MAHNSAFGVACSRLSMTIRAIIIWIVIAHLILDTFAAPVRIRPVAPTPIIKVNNYAVLSLEAECAQGKTEIACVVECAAFVARVRRLGAKLIRQFTNHKVGLGLALKTLSDLT